MTSQIREAIASRDFRGMISIMKDNRRNSEVQTRGCMGFVDIIKTAKDSNSMRQRLGRDGVVSTILEALDNHDHRDVHESGVEALETLAADSQNARQIANALDLILTSVMANKKAERSSASALVGCLRLLYVLSSQHGSKIIKCGGLSSIISCMRANHGERRIAEEGCLCICTYIHTNIHTYAHTHTYKYTHMHARMHACTLTTFPGMGDNPHSPTFQ
jgi:hypothetical protein